MKRRIFSRLLWAASLPALLLLALTPAGAQCPGVNCTATNVVNMPIDGPKATYSSGSTNVVFSTTATDTVQICGSATKTIRVTQAWFSGWATAVQTTPVALNLYSTSVAGGTVTAESIQAYDSTQAVASAVVNAYTTNPNPGTLVGQIWAGFTSLGNKTTGVGLIPVYLQFGSRPAHAVVLRGATQCLSWTLFGSGLTYTGNALSAGFEWTEE